MGSEALSHPPPTLVFELKGFRGGVDRPIRAVRSLDAANSFQYFRKTPTNLGLKVDQLLGFRAIVVLTLSWAAALPAIAKEDKRAAYSDGIAKKNIRIFEAKLKPECKQDLSSCAVEAANLIYYTAATKDYAKLYYYTRRIKPSSSTFQGADQCETLFQENANKQIVSINYWGAFYLAKKKLKLETQAELRDMLDYAFLCHIFGSWNERSDTYDWSPNEEVLTDVSSYLKEAEASFGSSHAAQYARFRREIADPYFEAYNKLVVNKKGKELSLAWAKTAVLTQNAHKATVAGKYPRMFAIHLEQRLANAKILVELSLRNP